jgi:hypothetical protein
MKHSFLLIFVFLLTLFANAQSPVFEWAKRLGGKYSDEGNSIAIDIAGNIYSTGYFNDTADFDPGPGTFNLISAAHSNDIFVSKIGPTGNIIWAKGIGTNSDDLGNALTTDKFGNVYITGTFRGTADFDPGPGIFNLTSTTSNCLFVTKLDSMGNLIWAECMNGDDDFIAGSIAVDINLNVVVTGGFKGTGDFDPGIAVFNLTAPGASGYSDMFVVKLDASGSFAWAEKFGSSAPDMGSSIAIDSLGYIYATGNFQGIVDFDPGSGVHNLTSSNSDVFVLKLDPLGNYSWVKQMGGPSYDYSLCIKTDVLNNSCIIGYFKGTADFDPGGGVYNLTSAGTGYNCFLTKLNSTGNFLYAGVISASSGSIGNALDLDYSGNIYATGYFTGTADFDTGPGVFSITSNGQSDAFILKMDSSGNFIWAKNLGGLSVDQGKSIAINNLEDIYSIGVFSTTADFNPEPSTYNLTAAGSTDIYIHKMSQNLPASLIEKNEPDNIFIYPNPSHDFFNLTISSITKNTTIEIYDAIGSLIGKKKIIAAETIIDLSNQPNGIYFIKIISDNNISTQKIIKQ